MAEFVPLQGPEKNSDASWYTSIGAGLVSGVLKTVEGVVSLGAELIDLGADSNKVADVEKFFDKINPFEEIADDRVIGKLTETLVSIGIPGAIGFKTATKLADKALKAKRAGKYANFKSPNAMKGLMQAEKLNKRAGYKRFAAGVFGFAAVPVGGNMLLSRACSAHGRRSDPYLNGINAAFGVGATLAPLLVHSLGVYASFFLFAMVDAGCAFFLGWASTSSASSTSSGIARATASICPMASRYVSRVCACVRSRMQLCLHGG